MNMRHIAILFLWLVFLSIPSVAAFCAYAEQLAPYAVPAGDNYSIWQFDFEGQDAYAIVSDEEVYSIVVCGQDGQCNAMLDVSALAAALNGYYSSSGRSPDMAAGLSYVHHEISKLSWGYAALENECSATLGIEKGECYENFSCQKACYSSEKCKALALELGAPLIDAIVEFENLSLGFGIAYSNERNAYAIFEGGMERDNALNYISAVILVNESAHKASGSPLLNVYSVCPMLEYRSSEISLVCEAAWKKFRHAEAYFTIPADAKAAKQRTESGVARMKEGAKAAAGADGKKSDDDSEPESIGAIVGNVIKKFVSNSAPGSSNGGPSGENEMPGSKASGQPGIDYAPIIFSSLVLTFIIILLIRKTMKKQ